MNKVFLHATYDCNARCIHCAVPRKQLYIDFEIFKTLVDSISMEYLIIGGGEPLKHQKIKEMIKYASSVTKVKIETNGFLLSEEFLMSIKQYLFQLNISIDGTEETHNKIRKIQTFEHSIKMIKFAREIGIDVAIWSVIMKDNVSELEKIVCLAKDIGVNKLSFLYATPVENCSPNLTIPFEEYIEVVRQIKPQEKDELQIRIAPYILKDNLDNIPSECLINDRELLHINPVGEIFPCVLLLDNPKYKLGTVQSGFEYMQIENPNICAGLIESLGEDPREKFGIPICPCRTISKEWKF